MHGHHGWGHWAGGHHHCDGGFGVGWVLPALIVGRLISDAFGRAEAWPAPQPPAPPMPPPAPARAPLAPASPTASQCPHCRAATRANFSFCPQCGHKLAPAVCAYCGQRLPVGATQCAHCGGPAR